MQVGDCHALRCAHGMFLLNAVKLISVRARRFPGPPDGARPAVARAERLLRTRRRLARAVSLLTHRSRAGLLKASSTPRRSLCFHLSFSHSRARNCSLRFDLRIAKRAGRGGRPHGSLQAPITISNISITPESSLISLPAPVDAPSAHSAF